MALTVRCDRCGTEKPAKETGNASGWTNATVTKKTSVLDFSAALQSVMSAGKHDLCPECSEGFALWIKNSPTQ